MDVGIGYLLFLLSVYADELWDGSSSGPILEDSMRHDVAILGDIV